MPRWAVVTLSVVAGAAVILVLGLFVFTTGEETAGPASTTGVTAPATEAAATEETTTEETTTEETTTAEAERRELRVTVRDAKPVGGVQHLTVRQGEEVKVRVASDVADEIHLHGYDLTVDVAAGGEAEIEFDATIVGRFEIELEERGTPIGELEVRP
jgi:heme/copper-type cytochrome/quinol oxidase subunit 2